jgi:hypothetical protein
MQKKIQVNVLIIQTSCHTPQCTDVNCCHEVWILSNNCDLIIGKFLCHLVVLQNTVHIALMMAETLRSVVKK